MPDLNWQKVALIGLLAFCLSLIADVPSNWGLASNLAKMLMGIGIVLVIVLPVRKALLLLLLLGLTGNDISFEQMDEFGKVATSSSIWELSFWFVKPSWIIFGCVFIQLVKLKQRVVPKHVRNVIIWFTTVPFITSFAYGGIFGPYANIEVLVDLKFALMLPAVLIIYFSLAQSEKNLSPQLLTILIGALLGRHGVDFVYFLLNVGPEIAEGVSRGSLDSAKGTINLMFYLGVIIAADRKKILSGGLLGAISLVLLMAYTTRMLWITCALGLIVLFFTFPFRKSILYGTLVGLIGLSGLGTIVYLHPDSAEVALLRFRTISEGRQFERFQVDVGYNFISRIGPVRYAEYLNIVESLGHRSAWLWGVGYGGYYEDEAVRFPEGLKTAFADYSFQSGQFFRAHFYPLHLLLKHGIIGLILISCVWIIPGYQIFKYLRKNLPKLGRHSRVSTIVIRCLVCFLITSMFQLYWSGKGLFISGVILACCNDFVYRYIKNKKTVKPTTSLSPSGVLTT